jgi:hypothetical protein
MFTMILFFGLHFQAIRVTSNPVQGPHVSLPVARPVGPEPSTRRPIRF